MIDSSPQAFRAEEMNTVKVRYIHSPEKKKPHQKSMRKRRDLSNSARLLMLFYTSEASITTAICKASDSNLPLEIWPTFDTLTSSP